MHLYYQDGSNTVQVQSSENVSSAATAWACDNRQYCTPRQKALFQINLPNRKLINLSMSFIKETSL